MKKKWFIGIDVSKLTLDVVSYDGKSKPVAADYLQVKNDSEGFQELLTWMRERGIRRSSLVVGLEHTGIYSMDISLFLERKGFDYCLFNPIHLKRSMGLVRGKSDRVDAYRIAYYTYLHRDELTYSHISDHSILALKQLLSERKLYVEQAAAHKALITDHKGRKESARDRRCEETIKYMESQIELIEKEIMGIIKEDPALMRNYGFIVSVKGIGFVNAVNFIVHTNNFQSFDNARQYACYTGIAPFEYSSGSSVRGRTKVSKMGARQVKADLTQAARSAVQYDPELSAYYIRKVAEGKAHGSVMNAVKFKLVVRVFSVIREQRNYLNPEEYQAYKKVC